MWGNPALHHWAISIEKNIEKRQKLFDRSTDHK